VVGRGVGYSLVEAPKEIQLISGTEIRKHKEIQFNGGRGRCLWFCGLPSSGKTTLAAEVKQNFLDGGYEVEHLDGDQFRRQFNPALGFSAEDRTQNLKNAMEVAQELVSSGLIVLASFITPLMEIQEEIKERGWDLIHVRCSKEICIKRDVKGLWKKALSGEISQFTGVDSPFNTPEDPSLIVDTDSFSLEESASVVQNYFFTSFPKRWGTVELV